MKAYTNTDLIESRAKWAKRLAPLTMLFLIGGLITNFLSINQPQYFRPTLILLAIGFTLSIFSSGMVNTWVREPRADQTLAATLKKFGNDFVLFSYTCAVPYVLLTPSRLYVIVAKRHAGEITVKGDRIRRKFTWMRLIRLFSDESMGAPVHEAQGKANKLLKALGKVVDEEDLPEISALVLFIHQEAELVVEEAPPIPVLQVNQIKRYLRENDKQRQISADQRKRLVRALGGDDFPQTS